MFNIRAWLSWGIAAVFVFYLFLLQASTSVMVHELVHAFSIDAAGVGLLSASYFYFYIILQMPAGSLVDRWGARLVLSLSMIGCAFACWLFASAHSLVIAEISRMLMGVMTAGGVVSALYLAANWFPLQRFALLAGLTEMLGMLGGAVGQNLLAHSVLRIGWRGTMIGCALGGIVLAVLTIGWLMDKPSGVRLSAHEKKHILMEFWQVLKIPQVWINGLFGGLIFAMVTGFAALWAVPYLMELYPIKLTTAAAASSMLFWGAACGGPMIGWFSAHVGYRRKIMQWGAFIVLLISLGIFYGPTVSLTWMFIALFVLGFFCGIYVLMFVVVCDLVPPALRGSAMGFTNMMCILFGAPLFQPLIGALLKLQNIGLKGEVVSFTTQNYRLAFIVLPLGIFLAWISTFFLHEKKLTNLNG